MKIKSLGANRTEIRLPAACVLVSYETPVAARLDGGVYYRTDKKYSKTTTGHINKWLSDNGAGAYTSKPQSFFDTLLKASH